MPLLAWTRWSHILAAGQIQLFGIGLRYRVFALKRTMEKRACATCMDSSQCCIDELTEDQRKKEQGDCLCGYLCLCGSNAMEVIVDKVLMML